jgi:NitT/TauT family transport system ATP-binding protein
VDGAAVAEALAAYDAERRPATAEVVLASRRGGPERVIDVVEARAPQGFRDLDAVAGYAEREAIVRGYATLAGYAPQQVNGREPAIPKLETRGLGKRYQLPVLEDLSLQVAPGELLCLLGPNGSGKTTLLRILAGLEAPDSGSVLVDGVEADRRARRRSVGVVFQEPRLLPWRTVRENVALCLKPLGLGSGAASRRATDYLRLVGLPGFEGYYPSRLSGGMQQRAAIARALAVEPEILFLDEPFSALDPETRRDLQRALVEIWRATGKTVVFVTHNLEEALAVGTRVALLTARPARLLRDWEVGDTGNAGDADASARRQALAAELLEHLAGQVRRQRRLDARLAGPQPGGSPLVGSPQGEPQQGDPRQPGTVPADPRRAPAGA